MASGEAPPEALPSSIVLTEEDRAIVVSRLARGVLKFQDSMNSSPGSPAGLLCQAWLPEVVENNQIVLKTKGLPFCVAGLGDLLALFRCISCRFAFGTNVRRPNTLGAPGRVFTSSEPEMCCNIQHYSKSAYLRKAEAEHCQVQSTLLLPLFISPRCTGCVGVLEVVQTSEDMAFVDVAALLVAAFEKCELYTCTVEVVRKHAPAATATTHMVLPAQMGVLALLPPGNTSEDDSASGARGSGGDKAMVDAGAVGGMPGGNGRGSGTGDNLGDVSDEEEDGFNGDDDGDEDGMSDGGRCKSGKLGDSKSGRRKGAGNPGKPGVRLTLADLQSQFGVGLKEAANRLGICPTTLKRACRRHGIQRWPRRQLQKVNRALDELEARQMMQPQQHLAAPMPGSTYEAAMGSLPAADTRWTTLSQFVPDYHTTALAGYNDQHLQLGPPVQGMVLPWPVVQEVQQQHLLAAQRQQQAQPLPPPPQRLQDMGGGGSHGGGGSGRHTPPGSSRISLPEGALAMDGGRMQEVPTVSAVSSLGHPPPQQQAQQHGQQKVQQQQQCHTLESMGRQHHPHSHRHFVDSLLRHQHGPPPPPAVNAQRQPSGSSISPTGVPPPLSAADYLHRVAAGAAYVSPFGPAAAHAAAGAPMARLPNGMGGWEGAATPPTSSFSVPSIHIDIMPSLSSHRCGADPLEDDDQVGFLDSSVLELLLTEEQRGELPAALRAGSVPHKAGAPTASGANMGAMSSELLHAMPGMSTGLSGLSFML